MGWSLFMHEGLQIWGRNKTRHAQMARHSWVVILTYLLMCGIGLSKHMDNITSVIFPTQQELSPI